MIRNIIFDWSGTLVDDLPAVWQASNAVLRRAGVAEQTLEQFRAEFCLPFRQFYDRFTPHLPLEQLESWFYEAFRQLQDLVTEIPQAREFLLFCRQRGMRTFLLSSVHATYFDLQSARNGFKVYLDHAYVEIGDKRLSIRELVAQHRLAAAETLLVGDMQHDIETAHWGGVRACAVLTGYNRRAQLEASQPDLVVANLGELRRHLESHQMDLQGRMGPLLPQAAKASPGLPLPHSSAA